MLPAYAELHCLSNFSFLRGASHPEELVERAQALGYAALAITDECSVAGAVRAHLAAKDAGLPLVIGSEFTLGDGVEARAARDRSRELRQPDAAHHARAAAGEERHLRADARRRRRVRRGPARAVGAARRSRRASATRPMPTRSRPHIGSPPRSRSRAWIAVELFARAGDRARLARCAELAQASGLPQVAAGDVHMHVRARRALQDTVTAIRLKQADRRMRPRALPQRRAAPALARRGSRRSIRRRCSPRPSRSRSAVASRSTSCATSIPRRSCRRARRRPRTLRKLTEAGLARRYPCRRAAPTSAS